MVVKLGQLVLSHATLFFLRSPPNLATVILAMDHIDHELTKYSINRKYLHSIHSGVSLAKETLNCYYSCTDHSEVYRIAMSKYDMLPFQRQELTKIFSMSS
jgi:hypothetical protein